jgi:energy-coupling factor transport system permease protein
VARARSTIGNGRSGGTGGTGTSWAAVAWLVWALSAAASVQLAPSPVYVALVIAVAALVVSVHGLDTPFARAFPILIGVGVVFALLRTVLTVATTHGGPGPTLFTTPHVTLPDALGGFSVGGPIELPILLQSAAEGFVIVGVMAVFGAFNAVVSHYELVQATPRAFYEIGLVLIVALAFVPSTIAAISAVRDADRARTGGRVVRRGRLVRLVVPILETGMERAVALAESMDSRGFGRGAATVADRVSGWLGFASLLALGGAFVALVGEARTAAVALGLAGAFGLAAAVLTASKGTQRARYRPRRLTWADWALIGASLLAPALLALLVVADDASLTWTASPLHWPTFHVLPALSIGLLLAPIARRPAEMRAPRSLSGLGERIKEPV